MKPFAAWFAGLAAARRGILWMLVAALLFGTQDAIAKALSETYSVYQVVWARFLFALLLMVLLFGRRLRGVMRTERKGLQTARALILLVMMGMFYAALSLIPLADATAILFLGPVLVTALSVPLLGEHVGPRRWTAVVIGFSGALIIIRPGTGVMEPAALLALAAAFLFGLYQIATRVLNRTDKPVTTVIYSALWGAAVMCVIVPFFWRADPDLIGWILFVALGFFGATSQFALTKAYEGAPAATVAPFFYSHLIWAVVFGFLLFADLPDLWTVTGALVIIASGLYVYHRAEARGAAGRDFEHP